MYGGASLATAPRRLAELDLFRSLSDDALSAVSAAMRVERVAKDTVVFEQGDCATRAYALDMGSLRIVQTGRDGAQSVVRFISPGEMCGTAALFTDHRLPADAIAAEESRVLSWSETDLLRIVHLHPPLAVNLIAVLGGRLRQLQERVRELTTQRAEQRLAQAILRLAEQAGRDGPGGRTITLPLRRKDLAEYSGTTLHTASRTLAGWEKVGLLSSASGRLTIRDLPGLRRIVEAPFEA